MKKLFAILLLSVYLFNLTGYNLVFNYLINNSDSQLTRNIDNNFISDKELIEVKVPLNMPYISGAKNFERVNGQLEIKGIQYNYVKRKVSGDTLYLLCIPNFCKTQLCNAKTDYAKESNDMPGKKGTDNSSKKSFNSDDYTCQNTQNFILAQSQSDVLRNKFTCSYTPDVFIKSLIHPPDLSTC